MDIFSKSSRGVALVAAAALVVAWMNGCDVASADQCASGASGDTDCELVLGVSAGAALCDNGTCRTRGTPQQSAGEGGVPDTGAAACTSTESCTKAAGGAPTLCREPGTSACVSIETDICKLAPGDFWKDTKNPIYIGVLYNKTQLSNGGSIQPYQAVNEKATQLAEMEWRNQTGGGINIGGERRGVVAVYCDIATDPDQTRRAFDHVTLDLGAPAVITETPQDANNFIDDAKARGTFVYLSEFGADVIASSGKLNGLVASNGPPIEYSRPMLGYVTSKLEAQIRTERALAPSAIVKVAVLASRNVDPSTTNYVDHLAELTINGQPANTQIGTAYKEINPGLDGDFTATSQAVIAFHPDIILTLEARDFHFWYLPLIEAGWPTGAPKPRYLTTESAAFAFRYSLSIGGNDELRRRVGGVSFAFDPDLDPPFEDFLTRYAAQFKEENTGYICTGYDAFDAVAYAIAGALTTPTVPSAKLRGVDIGEALRKRLTQGTKVPLFPKQIPSALATLAQGGNIDLVGAFSEMDWDPMTGASQNDSAPYCVQRNANDLSIWILASPTYHYKTKAVDTQGGDYAPLSPDNCP